MRFLGTQQRGKAGEARQARQGKVVGNQDNISISIVVLYPIPYPMCVSPFSNPKKDTFLCLHISFARG